MLVDTLRAQRAVLGDEHPYTLGSVNNLAMLLNAQGKPAEAELWHFDALRAQRAVLGDEHPHTLWYITNYVLVLTLLGNMVHQVHDASSRVSAQGSRAQPLESLKAEAERLGEAFSVLAL